jgi:hypothetical protein
LPVHDQGLIAGIGQSSIERRHQTQAPVSLPQEHHSTVTGDISTAKIGLDFAAIKAWKSQFFRVTIWH